MKSERTLLASLGLLWFWAGCGGDCTEASLCDIRTRSCQQQTMESVACLRGRAAIALPEVRVVSESKLRQVFDEERAKTADDMRSVEERAAQVARWSRGLSLLGLSPPDYSQSDADNDSASEIAAVYLHSSKQILIVDRGSPSDDREAVAVLAHETVHAMQDAELDLEAYLKRWTASYDERLAVKAITEGEAVLYELLTVVALDGRNPEQLNWQSFFDRWRVDTLEEADEDDAPISMASLRFPYAFGGGYVAQHWLARGRVGVEQLFEQPPRSTAEVMFGTPQPHVLNARDALHEVALPSLGESYQPVSWMTAGAWIARQYTRRVDVTADPLRRAEVLLADMLSVHYDAEVDHVVTAWKIRATNDEQREPWLSAATWRAGDHQSAYLLVGEPQDRDSDDSRVVLVDDTKLEWNAPPQIDTDTDTDEANADASRELDRSRHVYAATRPLPVAVPPSAL